MKTLNPMQLMILIVGLLTAIVSQAQSCNDNTFNNISADQFVSKNDGTATDKVTGLMWQVCSAGQTFDNDACNDAAGEYNWLSAIQFANESELGGFDDWRLPNIKELMSIQTLNCVDPSVNISVFLGIQSSYYWTATPTTNAGRVWLINLNESKIFSDSNTLPYHALLVRDL